MLSKKHSDPFYWKNKLEALTGLPEGSATGKDTMWEKLQDRLQQKPSYSKAVLYWIAAASMPLIIVTLIMINKTENILVSSAAKKEKSINIVPASKESLTVSTSPAVVKKQPVAESKQKVKNKIIVNSIKTNDSIVAVKALPENPGTGIAVNMIPPVDTNLSIATTVITKKKLHVVHINELETLPPQFAIPVNYVKNLSEIKTKKSKVNNLSFATQQNSIGFKIKLSSKN